MKKLVLIISLLAIYNVTFAQNKWFTVYSDSNTLIKDGDKLIADFEKKIKKINKKISLKNPKTVYNLMGPYYSPNANTLNLPIWDISPKWYKDFCVEVAGGAEVGKKMFGLFFNGFYVSHELGHTLQYAANNRADNEYDNEYIANIIGLLYWKKKGKQNELRQCYEFAKQALSKIKNPIPQNEDIKKYFTEHYQEFGQDPYKYGFVQFSQYVKVYEDKTLTDFDTFIKGFINKQ